jgi:small subunit ribosomal protein S7
MRGKKATAEKVVYGALEIIKEKTKQEAIKVFDVALRNITPALEVKARRVGGSTYQVPVEVSPERGRSMALSWLRDSARSRGGRSMSEKLAAEIIDASNNTGGAIGQKDTLHKTAEANRAFAHFRW